MNNYVLREYDDSISFIKNLIKNRNIPTEYINETIYGLDDAVNRIIKAINSNEYIGVFTD